MLYMEVTWWAEDGSERRGRVGLAPNASPETAAALASMLRLAAASETSRAESAADMPNAADTLDAADSALEATDVPED